MGKQASYNFDDILSSFDIILECDGRTDRRTKLVYQSRAMYILLHTERVIRIKQAFVDLYCKNSPCTTVNIIAATDSSSNHNNRYGPD